MGPLILRGLVVFFAVFLTFVFIGFSSEFVSVSKRMDGSAVHGRAIGGHVIALASFGILSQFIYHSGSAVGPTLVVCWLGSGVAAIWFGAAAFVRPVFWGRMARSTGYLWVLALMAAVSAAFGGTALRPLWPRATAVTFGLVDAMLRPFGAFTGDPATMIIGSSRFSVNIAPACSGLEGIGLILAFTTVWLVLFRKEIRFPQALVLLPLGVAILFLLNSARIAALILIGHAGFDRIALGGFHSQAGWIAFNFVALGICLAARQSSWISKRQRVQVNEAAANITAPWVMPFVAILALGMVSHAFSGGFEWLYPLRLASGAAALWFYREQYKSLDWRVDWMGLAGGVLVFAIWIALDHSGTARMPAELAAASRPMRIGWVTMRVLAAAVTVPIAEELAFRGYLLRRFIAPEFDEISFRRFSWLAVLGSSVLFGLLHGQRWIAGSLAGVIFAVVMLRRGRFGSAVAAHAVANALLALDVLCFGRWGLW